MKLIFFAISLVSVRFPIFIVDTYDNVMKWMRGVQGPLSVLRNCVERKVKVKIMTRGATTMRGYVTGYVIAFDKIWNLAVEDATEVWTRNIKKKIPALDGVPKVIPSETSARRMTAPTITVTKLSKKMEQCERKIEKLLVRGEHIVAISIIDY